MTSVPEAAGPLPAAASTSSGRALSLAGWGASPEASQFERDALIAQARETDAARQLQRCFPRWAQGARAPVVARAARAGRQRARRPQRPRRVAQPRRGRARGAAPPRHHPRQPRPPHPRPRSAALIDGQARRRPRRRPGLDARSPSRRARLDEALRRAHARLPIDLDDPARVRARRRAAPRARPPSRAPRRPGRRPLALGARPPRRVRPRRPALLADRLADLAGARRRAARARRARRAARSACSSSPALKGQRLAAGARALPGHDPADRRARRAAGARPALAPALPGDARRRAARARQRAARCTPGPRSCLDAAGQLAQELTRALRADRRPGRAARQARPLGPPARAPQQLHRPRRRARQVELALRVVTFPAREFTQRRLGAAPRDDRYAQPSAVMELGEAVQTAVDRGLPLLLSTEAAGQLKDTIRVGRMKGRPGMLTITTADGLSRHDAARRRRAGDRRAARAQARRRAA